PESLVRDRRPVGRRPAAPVAPATKSPEARDQKVAPTTNPETPRTDAPASAQAPAAAGSGGFFAGLLRRGGDTPSGRVRVPDTKSADGRAIPPVPQQSRPSNPAAAVPAANTPPAAAATPGN